MEQSLILLDPASGSMKVEFSALYLANYDWRLEIHRICREKERLCLEKMKRAELVAEE